MPYTPAQHRLFEAAAHNPAIAKARGIPQGQASKMAGEGIKRQSLATALKKKSYNGTSTSGIGGV